MVRCGRLTSWRRVVRPLLSLALIVSLALPAGATMKFGKVQLSGNLETQNIIRHPNPETAQFVMNRNTARIRVDWDWIDRGKFMDTFEVPFLKRSKLYLLYRGVYDGFYDIAPGGRQRGITRFDDLVGGPIIGNTIGGCRRDLSNPDGSCDIPGARLKEGLYSRFNAHSRGSLKIENRLREAYIDLKLQDVPLSFRIGRQQVIWGESDQFRLMDIWNPLDLTWHLVEEPFEEIRVPLWLIKGLWDIGSLGPLNNTFLEVVYNAFDFQPGAKVAFVPRPWAAPFPDPTRCIPVPGLQSPDGGPVCGGQIQIPFPKIPSPRPTLLSPSFDLQGTSVRNGDFQRNPADASEIGWRFHGVTQNGVEFTINHIYGRSRGIGAIAGSPFKLKIESIELGNPEPALGTFEGLPVAPAYVKAKYMHPYSHIFGFTANYFEGDYTQMVFRLETAYQLGAAVQTIEDSKRVPVTRGGINTGQLAPLGYDRRNVWAGMVGFDRPTWLRFINSRATWLISGQFFWSYIDGNVSNLRDVHQTAGQAPYYTPGCIMGDYSDQNLARCRGEAPRTGYGPAGLVDNGVGVWDSGPFAGLVERTQDGSYPGNQDQLARWETLVTLAMTSFYRGGTLVPFLSFALDPTNANFNANLDLQYFYTNDIVFTIQQKYFSAFGGGPSLEPWGVGGLNVRRDETILKLTYQF